MKKHINCECTMVVYPIQICPASIEAIKADRKNP